MKNLLIVIAALAIISCSSNKQHELLRLYSCPIKFPSKARITINSRDTVISNFHDSKIKVVVYADATTCASCEIKHLELWKPYIDSAKRVEFLSYYFILAPDKKDSISVMATLKAFPLDYPITLDYGQEFQQLNDNLPQDKNFHSLILDKNNMVVLAGNPIHNLAIRNLFHKTLDNMARNDGVYIPDN